MNGSSPSGSTIAGQVGLVRGRVDVRVAVVLEDPEEPVQPDVDRRRLHHRRVERARGRSDRASISARMSRSDSSTRTTYRGYSAREPGRRVPETPARSPCRSTSTARTTHVGGRPCRGPPAAGRHAARRRQERRPGPLRGQPGGAARRRPDLRQHLDLGERPAGAVGGRPAARRCRRSCSRRSACSVRCSARRPRRHAAAPGTPTAPTVVPPNAPSPLQPGQVMLNGVPTPVSDTAAPGSRGGSGCSAADHRGSADRWFRAVSG